MLILECTNTVWCMFRKWRLDIIVDTPTFVVFVQTYWKKLYPVCSDTISITFHCAVFMTGMKIFLVHPAYDFCTFLCFFVF